jgi:hypothetical protein
VLLMAFSVTGMKCAMKQRKVAAVPEILAGQEQAVTKKLISVDHSAVTVFVMPVKIAPLAQLTVSEEQLAEPAGAVLKEGAMVSVSPIKKILPVLIAGQPIVAETASVRGKRIIATAQ